MNGAAESARAEANGTSSQQDTRSAQAKRPSANGKQDDRREYRWGRRVPDAEAHDLVEKRLDQTQRRRRTNRRTGLDQPLPEDIAFRAAAEGGDRTILPARRRRPGGLRETERVILAGPRSLSGWSHWGDTATGAPPAPESEAPALLPGVTPPHTPVIDAAVEAVSVVAPVEPGTERDADEEDGEETSTPRRRGRRGGRGRRRPGESDAATIDSVEAGEPSTNGAYAPDDEDNVETAPATPRIPDAIDPDGSPPAFVALGIDRRSLAALARFRFEEPTPIQERAIPALLNGLDVVGVAQTGSGKTVAFGVPMMERLDGALREVQGIVLVPTRELAQQVLEVLEDLGKPWDVDAIGLLGGRRLDDDFRALKANPQVVVGTPGRIIDHLNRGTLSLRHVRYAVLDEADQMLDIGFLPDIRRILSRTPKRRQTCLFSATMPSSIRRLVWQFMDDPETVTVDRELSTVDSIEQVYMEIAQRDKVRGLRELIERELKGRTLVFSRTKRGVDHLERQLGSDGVRVGALHGDMDQRRRDRVVQDFRAGKLDILIATNVAARGLDIPEITHVVNYDVPQNAEEYVHRIGRTGRAGRAGKAITFVCEWDMQEFDVILNEFGEQVSKEEFDLYAPRG